jgi:hypothetical protein
VCPHIDETGRGIGAIAVGAPRASLLSQRQRAAPRSRALAARSLRPADSPQVESSRRGSRTKATSRISTSALPASASEAQATLKAEVARHRFCTGILLNNFELPNNFDFRFVFDIKDIDFSPAGICERSSSHVEGRSGQALILHRYFA